MSNGNVALRAGQALSFQEFSDSSRDAIFDTMDYLSQHSVAPCDLNDLHRIAMQAVKKDHDPSETILRSRILCRFGCLVGSIAFICQELEAIHADLEMQSRLSEAEASVSLQLAFVRAAQDETHRCFRYLAHKNMPMAHQHFQEAREAIANLRKVLPTSQISIEAQRILHTTALASQMLEYAAGK